MIDATSEFTNGEVADARLWLEMVTVQSVQSALESIFKDLDDAVQARGPVCWSSGRCCRFDAYGHRLYTTGLEVARTWRMMNEPIAPQSPSLLPILASSPPECRYQVENRCSARAARPAGCRVYFCEKGAEDWQQDIYERAMSSIRKLHDEINAPYRFAEWRFMLDLMDATAERY